jgi:hypothetical protein
MIRCRTPWEMAQVQQRYVESSLYSLSSASARLVHAASRLAGAGLYPVHRTAAANARRLAAE